MSNRFAMTFTAAPEHIDENGHVNNTVWVRWMEDIATAHWMRDANPAHVARQVVGLDRPQTASMGVIEVPPDAVPRATFAELYSRADRLLYEAKQAGRNRTLSERLKAFIPRRNEGRRKKAA